MPRALLHMLLLAGCASEPATGFELDLRWRTTSDQLQRQVRISDDGGGFLRLERAGEREPPRHFLLEAAQATELREALSLCGTLPRAAHAMTNDVAISVVLSITRRGQDLQWHEGWDAFHPGLIAIARVLHDAVPEAREHSAPLLALAGRAAVPTWSLPRRGDPTFALRQALCQPSSNRGVVVLAARLCAELSVYELAPCVREQFVRTGSNDPQLAIALLSLGDPLGVELLVREGLAAEPERALPALGALNGAFAHAYGRAPLASFDFVSEHDPRPAAAALFLAWLAAHRDSLHYVAPTRSYAVSRV